MTAAPGGQLNVLNFTVAAGFNPGLVSDLRARFRLYDASVTATPAGGATSGEVEDYTFSAVPTGIGLSGFSAVPVPAIWLLGAALATLLGLLSVAAVRVPARVVSPAGRPLTAGGHPQGGGRPFCASAESM